MKFQLLSAKYSIEIPLDDFFTLHNYEETQCDLDDMLFKCLERMGIQCDYNIYCGPVIEVELNSDQDTFGTKRKVISIIQAQIKKAKEWQMMVDKPTESV